jgi:hypothetical protein
VNAWKQFAYCHQQEDETIFQFYHQFMEIADQAEWMYVKIDEKQK